MRALRLDYQRVYKPIPWLGLLVLAAALAALALTGAHYHSLNQRAVYWEGRLGRLQQLSGHRAPASRPLTEQDARAQLLEIRQANQVVRQLSQPWNALFRAVETSGGQGIALLSLEPDLHKGRVKISGEAKDLDALLKYVRQLSTCEAFGSVFLQSHQVQQDDPEKPLHFSVIANWKGAAP